MGDEEFGAGRVLQGPAFGATTARGILRPPPLPDAVKSQELVVGMLAGLDGSRPPVASTRPGLRAAAAV